MDTLRQRLDELKATSRALPAYVRAGRGAPPARLEEVLGGQAATGPGGGHWIIETPLGDIWQRLGARPPALAAALACPGHKRPLALRRMLVVDIETGGFSGTPVFLIGAARLDTGPPAVVQLLARDYSEEESILRGFLELAGGRDTWVTFNGRSFDEPFLRDRATRYRVKLPPPRTHVDVLVGARRRWAGELPNCRLVTLEQHILKRVRVGDVPSSDVPDLFHHYFRTGNAAPLRPVLEHNRVDLASTIELLARLGEATE